MDKLTEIRLLTLWKHRSVCVLLLLLITFWNVNCVVFVVSDNQVERNYMLDVSKDVVSVAAGNESSTVSSNGSAVGKLTNKTRRSSRKETDLQQEEYAMLARENVLQMRSDSIRCATPRPRVIKVQDAHPHAYKRFVPSCVVLHRCDRESGCCDDENNVCSVVQKQRTFMYFYVVALGEQDGVASVGVYGQVERLRFTNHTRCGCRKRKINPAVKTPPLIGESSEGESGGVRGIHNDILSFSTTCFWCCCWWWCFLTAVPLLAHNLS